MSEKTFMDRAWGLQKKVDKKLATITTGRYARVIKMARKPTPEEFKHMSTITLVGVAVVGAIGFAVYLFMDFFLGVIGA